jgi:UDP-N-acetylmuramoylalanine--D-glutamate ligase
MKDYKAYFKNKKITVIGLGLLGRGVGDVKFLAQCGANLTVTDLKTEAELEDSLKQLKGQGNIKFVLGKHRLEDFRVADLVLKAAGIPIDSPFIAEARKNNVPVEMSAALFVKLSPATIVGVTGTRGKSTVASMIYEILKASGKKTFLGGNTRGVSTLAHLSETSKDEFTVLELDSWQLQGFGESQISPHVSVFTNFLSDHLNYYSGGLDQYFEDKANIFKYQSPDDQLIVGEQVAKLINDKYPEHAKRAKVVENKDLPKDWELKVLGDHNRHNAALAMEASEVLGIEGKVIKKALESFQGVEGRLELVRELKGVKIYNDTTATTPDATLAALKALGDGKPGIILIIGGSDKGLDFTELLEALRGFCKTVITIPGTGTEKLTYNLEPVAYKLEQAHTLEEAVNKAVSLSEAGDAILFSPAFASFGLPPGGFKNEFDRGDQFNRVVQSL